ncbi:MAG: InlB B-repeat-containing protein, partial [Lawsonibacter sp.]|nr:InlB B-repeat-containing protein [Lawsonibacter sp.]
NGNFNPDDYVTREQMAVIMSKLLNLDYNYYQGTNPFSDVPAWAAPYVAACAANGITSGIGGGMYGAGQNVNAVQAALMMLKALGYFQYQQDFGDSYVLATVKQATEVGLFDYIDSNAQSSLTRNEVAQMALNALKSDMVTFTGDVGTKIPTAQGDVIVGYKPEYTSRTSTLAKYHAIEGRTSDVVGGDNINRGQYYIQLGEELYNGELKLTKYDDDIFMRPSRHWEYKGQEIGTYMKKENIKETYTKGVNCRTLYDLIGRNNLNDYEFTYYVDGVDQTGVLTASTAAHIMSRQDKTFGATGRGVLTQVFVDIEAETIDITSINTWLGKATADYSTTRESATFNIYTSYNAKKTVATPKTVAKADVAEVEDVKVDDYVLVTMSGKNKNSLLRSDMEVVSISDVEILSNSTLTKFSNRSDDPDSDTAGKETLFDSVTTGGTKYDSSKQAWYSDDVLELYDNQKLTDKAYNVYLDKYGYAIGVDLYSGGDNYVFISGVKMNDSTISATYADANGIFLDGTMKTINVNVKDTNKNVRAVLGGSLAGKDYFKEWNSANYGNSGANDIAWAIMNRWFTYTVNKDGVYTLTPAGRMFTTEVNTTNYPDSPSPGAKDRIIKCNNVVLDATAKDAADTSSVHPGTLVATRAYGNDESIYIIPELDHVSGKGVTGKVISGVDGLYTGVQNVEITVAKHDTGDVIYEGLTDETMMYDSVYTVYDKDNYIIASIVIGEAKGTAANYAYILSNTNAEWVDDDGTYYWEFDAVVNGEKTTLTAHSKFKSTMKELRVGHIQELRYTGEYVTAVKDVDPAKIYSATNAQINETKHEVYDIGHEVNDGECSDSTCTQNDAVSRLTIATAPNLHLEKRTLKLGVDNTNDWGLTFVDVNVPTVVIQPVDGVKKTQQYDSVPDALAALGDADGNESDGKLGFEGRLVAALDGTGRAKWIVILSDTNVTTKGVDPTGSTVDIIVKCYLNDSGVKDLYSTTTIKQSTKTLVGGVWTITAPAAPAGYHALAATKTVTYVKGQKTYEVEFNYVKDAPVAYTVSFDGNGSDGGTAPAALTETNPGAGVTLPAAGVTKTGYIFAGWGEAATDTTATAGAAGATYNPTANCTLYAIWREQFTVDFNANTGSGAIAALTTDATGKVTVPANGGDFTAPAGFKFKEWRAGSTTGTVVPAGDYTPAADTTLYAIWEENTVSGTVAVAGTGYEIVGTSTFTNLKGTDTLEVTLKKADGSNFSSESALGVTGTGATTPTIGFKAGADAGTEATVIVVITMPAQNTVTDETGVTFTINLTT